MKSSTPSATPPSLVALVCRALDEKKAADLRVLHVSEHSSITDYLVIATGTSEPHLRALRVELEKVIDATGTRILGMDKGQESGWLVVDAFDVMIHVFTPANRDKYSLENLWKDAEEIPLERVLAPEAPAAGRAPKKKAKASPKKKATSVAKKTTATKKPSATKKPAAAKKKAAKVPARKAPARRKA